MTRVFPQGHGGAADLEVVKGLIEDTVFSTQPAMVLSLRACASSPSVSRVRYIFPPFCFLKQMHVQTGCCMIHDDEIYFFSVPPGLRRSTGGRIEVHAADCVGETTTPPAAPGDFVQRSGGFSAATDHCRLVSC